MPRVSVIMNCLNGEAYLEEALDSIYSQTFQDWEIIFWDNVSTDRSKDIANLYDQRLKYYKSPKRTALGAARNSAIEKAQGTYIAFLDTDDKWFPNKLEAQVDLMDHNQNIGLSHTDVIYHYQSDGTNIGHFSTLGEKPVRGNIFGYLLRVNAIAMPSVMLRRTALQEQSIWFDERFEIYPDFDLFRRIAYRWECDYIDEALATYRIHTKSSSTTNHLRAAWELEQTLERFCDLLPDISVKYSDEVASLRTAVEYQKGKSNWRAGRRRTARRIFASRLTHPKMRSAYFAAFFPYGLVEWAWRRVNSLFRGRY
jgi:glycosyltransferase involved in cell wall biosynthesis